MQETVNEFNTLTLNLLAQLPKAVPRFALQIQSFAVAFAQVKESEPDKPIRSFANYLVEFRKTKPDIKNFEEGFILAFGPDVVGCDIKEAWTALSAKSRDTIIEYIQKMISLQNIFTAYSSIDFKQMQERLEAMVKSMVTGDDSGLTDEERQGKALALKMVTAAEQARGKPFDLSSKADMEELTSLKRAQG